MVTILLKASRNYYEYTLKARGHFALDELEEFSVYGLQAYTGGRNLKLIQQEQKREELSLSIPQLKAKRYYLLGRHIHSHQLLHQSFLRVGLKKLGQLDLIQEGDLVFVGSQVDEEQMTELDSRRAWLIDEEQTQALHENIKIMTQSQENEFHERFAHMLSHYLHYPDLKVCSHKLQQYLSIDHSEHNQNNLLSEASDQMLAELRIVVLGAKTQVGSIRSQAKYLDSDQAIDCEIRWSHSHLAWANLVVIMWRAHKAQELKPFALTMERLMSLLCFEQATNSRINFLLLYPIGVTKRSKLNKLLDHQETWKKWAGRGIESLSISHENYDALDRGKNPSFDLNCELHEYLDHSMYRYQDSTNIDGFTPFSFKLLLPKKIKLNLLPCSAEIITKLGLIQQDELSKYEIESSGGWCLTQALSQQCLVDAFGEHAFQLLKILELLSPNLRESSSIQIGLSQVSIKPMLLTASQALLLCDLINLCFNFETIYLEKSALTKTLLQSSGKLEKVRELSSAVVNKNFRQSAELLSIPLKSTKKSSSVSGFRMLSHMEREILEPDDIPALNSGCYSLNSDLLAWTEEHEWTHDDFFYWGLKVGQNEIHNPFWASISNAGAQQSLGEVRIQKWQGRIGNKRLGGFGKYTKKSKNLATLRLIYM